MSVKADEDAALDPPEAGPAPQQTFPACPGTTFTAFPCLSLVPFRLPGFVHAGGTKTASRRWRRGRPPGRGTEEQAKYRQAMVGRSWLGGTANTGHPMVGGSSSRLQPSPPLSQRSLLRSQISVTVGSVPALLVLSVVKQRGWSQLLGSRIGGIRQGQEHRRCSRAGEAASAWQRWHRAPIASHRPDPHPGYPPRSTELLRPHRHGPSSSTRAASAPAPAPAASFHLLLTHSSAAFWHHSQAWHQPQFLCRVPCVTGPAQQGWGH